MSTPRRFPLLSVFVVWLILFVVSSSHHAHHQHCIGISVAASFQNLHSLVVAGSRRCPFRARPHSTRPRHRRNPVFKVRLKLSLIEVKLGTRSRLVIARPPVEFRRDRRPSGTRTVDRSGTVFGYSSDVCRCFKSRCRAAPLPSHLILASRPRWPPQPVAPAQ